MASEWVLKIQEGKQTNKQQTDRQTNNHIFTPLVVRNNINLEHYYHPGVFEDSKWSCCGNKPKLVMGCTPTFINPNKQKPPSRDTRSQLPPLPSTPSFPGRTDEQEQLAKRSASDPATLNGAVGTGDSSCSSLFICLFVCLLLYLFVYLFVY